MCFGHKETIHKRGDCETLAGVSVRANASLARVSNMQPRMDVMIDDVVSNFCEVKFEN